MGVLTYKGATAHEVLGSELAALVPTWAAEQGFENDKEAVEGAKLFAALGCMNCHTYAGDGTENAGAPDLSAEGAKLRGVEWQIEHLECPACKVPGSKMPSYGSQGEANLRKLATFLEASKGGE
jgi:cytochrome c2